MERVAPKIRSRAKRDEVIGVTSDGVRVLRQGTRGRRNLTDKQVREIVRDLRDAVDAARRARSLQDS
jgi:ribosome-binding protein aMBF1 (putative translation factor)